MKNMKIFSRLIMSFSIVIALALALGIVGIVSTNVISAAQTRIYNENTLGLAYTGQAARSFQKLRAAYFRMIVMAQAGNHTEYETSKNNVEIALTELDDYIELYRSTMALDEEEEIIGNLLSVRQAVHDAVDVFKQESEKIINGSTDYSSLYDAIINNTGSIDTMRDNFDRLFTFNEQFASDANEDGDRLAFTTTIVQISVLALIVVVSIAVALIIAKGIESQLGEIIGKLINTSNHISDATGQLSEASDSLATGSSKQAAAIEETSATMNETSSMIAQNAENTRHAAQLAATSKDNADKGKVMMGEMVRSMEELKESSDTIGKIVKTIDDISFQTNLLAINATVEAARAGGDAGRSFSVVANEVRNLAQMSAKAAAETTEIIEKNISLTNTSREESREVAGMLETITSEFENLNKMIDEVNAASEEQANGVKQINQAMSQMEKVTQQNAAVAEENAATAGSMQDDVASLNEAVELAKMLLRNTDSIENLVRKEEGKGRSGIRTSSQRPVLTTPPVSGSSAAKSKPSQSAKINANDNEKIIPLDADDDF